DRRAGMARRLPFAVDAPADIEVVRAEAVAATLGREDHRALVGRDEGFDLVAGRIDRRAQVFRRREPIAGAARAPDVAAAETAGAARSEVERAVGGGRGEPFVARARQLGDVTWRAEAPGGVALDGPDLGVGPRLAVDGARGDEVGAAAVGGEGEVAVGILAR